MLCKLPSARCDMVASEGLGVRPMDQLPELWKASDRSTQLPIDGME